MKRLKKLIALISVAIVTVALVGCGAKEITNSEGDKDNKTEEKQKITIGAMSSVDVIPFVVAKEKGYLEKNGVDLDLQVFKSAKDRDAAFQSGALDGVFTDIVAVALYQNGGFDVRIAGVTDGDFMLVAGKDSKVKTIGDVKDKKIGISEKTVIEYTLDEILKKNSIEIKEVEKTFVPAIPTRLEMLANNKIDVALLPEPFATLAINDGGILLGSASAEGMLPAVSAFSKKALDEKSKGIENLYKAYDEAVEYINSTDIKEYENLVIETVGYPETAKGTIKLPKFRKTAVPSKEELQRAIDWAVSNGICSKDIKPENLVK
ncbi:MetQ/NlpA family ABC transporter substrate-binding protein [Clostridium sp.]|uniref:ABC transporter substrate-binding protein n=1 Tax=Clostridium sp. TaxID=1506 RepID=UPI002FC6AB96